MGFVGLMVRRWDTYYRVWGLCRPLYWRYSIVAHLLLLLPPTGNGSLPPTLTRQGTLNDSRSPAPHSSTPEPPPRRGALTANGRPGRGLGGTPAGPALDVRLIYSGQTTRRSDRDLRGLGVRFPVRQAVGKHLLLGVGWRVDAVGLGLGPEAAAPREAGAGGEAPIPGVWRVPGKQDPEHLEHHPGERSGALRTPRAPTQVGTCPLGTQLRHSGGGVPRGVHTYGARYPGG